MGCAELCRPYMREVPYGTYREEGAEGRSPGEREGKVRRGENGSERAPSGKEVKPPGGGPSRRAYFTPVRTGPFLAPDDLRADECSDATFDRLQRRSCRRQSVVVFRSSVATPGNSAATLGASDTISESRFPPGIRRSDGSPVGIARDRREEKIAPGFRPGLQPKPPRVPYGDPAMAYSDIPPIYGVYAPPYASVRAGRSPARTLFVKKRGFPGFPAFFPGRNPAGTLSARKRGFLGFPGFLLGKNPARISRARRSARRPARQTLAASEVPPGLFDMTSTDMSDILQL